MKRRKKEDKEREKRDMGLSEQRSWKDKDHIAFLKKQELLMMSHYTHTHTHIAFLTFYSEKHHNLTRITAVNI